MADFEKRFVNKIITGNALEVLKQMPDESVNCIISSPPYWALRAYNSELVVWDGDKNCKHSWGDKLKRTGNEYRNDKGNLGKRDSFDEISKMNKATSGQFCSKCGAWRGELGLEPDFNLYIKHLCDIYDEVFRVLRKDGTCWINIGDTYNSHTVSKEWADKAPDKKLADGVWRSGGRNSQYKAVACRNSNIGLPDKCLCLIPDRLRIELVNRGWIIRNKIIWQKPNPMPSSAKDRFTVDFEDVIFMVKQQKYFFEPQYEEYLKPLDRWGGDQLKANGQSTWDKGTGQNAYRDRDMRPNPLGRSKRTTWVIPTYACPMSHFAVFPPALVKPMILAGCPKEVCKKCGQGRRKVYEFSGGTIGKDWNTRNTSTFRETSKTQKLNSAVADGSYKREFKGYTDCGCGEGFRPGIVMDMFAGTGTVGEVAAQLGRDYILIDIQPTYVKEMAEPRLKAVETNVPVAERKHGQMALYD
jgi:site-specific DNA-methyltransferase (adenine-specific)